MTLGIIKILGMVVFLYLLWRNLRENYDDQKVIVFSWVGLLGFLVTGRLVYGLINWGIWNNDLIDWISVTIKPGMSYIGGYLGLVLMAWLFSHKEQWKFLNFMEDIIGPFLIMFWFLMVDELVRTKLSLEPLVFLVLSVLIFLLIGWVKTRYRSFVWYKSGKKGFVLLFSNFLFFLILLPVLIFLKENPVNMILVVIISLISLVGLFILGGENYERK